MFYQDPPKCNNPFRGNRLLQNWMHRIMPGNCIEAMFEELHYFGDRLLREVDYLGQEAERDEPRLEQYDAWGNRIDRILTSSAWKQLDAISAETGLVAIGYERKFGSFSRAYQFAKLLMFHPFSAVYTCPLAMTDGAASA